MRIKMSQLRRLKRGCERSDHGIMRHALEQHARTPDGTITPEVEAAALRFFKTYALIAELRARIFVEIGKVLPDERT